MDRQTIIDACRDILALNETERVAFHAGYCFRMDVEVENMRDLLDLARKQE